MSCRVIAVANQKGGVGKTTTTFNLGAGLTKYGKKVLLVDGDPQGSLTVSYGVRTPDKLEVQLATLMQGMINDEPVDPTPVLLHHKEGMDLLPANIELSGVENALFNCMSREYVLRRVLEPLREQYDYILIDCMPALGMMTINALVAADSVVIPVQPDFLSAKGLDLLIRSVMKVRRQINPNLRIDGILLTMVDARTNNAKNIISSLRESVDGQVRVFRSEIGRSVRSAECSLYGCSIFVHDACGKVAAAYDLLTQEILEIEENGED